jgi:hypothetical protein
VRIFTYDSSDLSKVTRILSGGIMIDPKYPPLLKITPYVGSATNRVVHKTDSNCPAMLDIPPNERWYVKDIPGDGNYVLCDFCFPRQDSEQDEEGVVSEDFGTVRPLSRPGDKAPSPVSEKAAKVPAGKKKAARASSRTSRLAGKSSLARGRASKKAPAGKAASKKAGSPTLTKLLSKKVKTSMSGRTREAVQPKGDAPSRGVSAVAPVSAGKKALSGKTREVKPKTSLKSSGKKGADKKVSAKKTSAKKAPTKKAPEKKVPDRKAAGAKKPKTKRG